MELEVCGKKKKEPFSDSFLRELNFLYLNKYFNFQIMALLENIFQWGKLWQQTLS